jgi:hypothetical protein
VKKAKKNKENKESMCFQTTTANILSSGMYDSSGNILFSFFTSFPSVSKAAALSLA